MSIYCSEAHNPGGRGYVFEKCRSCGYEHEDLERVVFKRNHVSNRILPYCNQCMRRLYQVPYRPEKEI